MSEFRDTQYAQEIARATVELQPGNEIRLERLYIKAMDQEEVRFSWWPNGRLAQKPLDVTEPELLMLMEEGVKQDVFTREFLEQLRELLSRSLK